MKLRAAPKQTLYQPHEFAKNAGVTVRTLHYYDRLGLLKPSNYTGAGFRMYGEGDVARLQQIVTLKFIGFSLKEIKRLLDSRNSNISAALKVQRITLSEKRRHLDSVIATIAKAERLAISGNTTNWDAFRKIIQEIQMPNQTDWLKKYYSEEARKELARRARAGDWTPALQTKAEGDWQKLIRQVQRASSTGEDPAGKKAQALAARWLKLVEAFTRGHPAIKEGLNKLYADPSARKSAFRLPLDAKVTEFIGRAMEVYRQKTLGKGVQRNPKKVGKQT
ncbi:MAG: MerR family transcriptional regulator [Chthoniobacter sp.]|nr:MerR family transcriptional regulator [Chthoniobacter sp.]